MVSGAVNAVTGRWSLLRGPGVTVPAWLPAWLAPSGVRADERVQPHPSAVTSSPATWRVRAPPRRPPSAGCALSG
jgi:hypothetical protein